MPHELMAMRNRLGTVLLPTMLAMLLLACTRSAGATPTAAKGTASEGDRAPAPPAPKGTTAPTAESSGPFALPDDPVAAADAGLPSHSFEHDGLQRSYRLIVPASYEPGQPAPLVLALHGGGGTGLQMCTLQGGIQELAEEERFLVVCPDAVENHWNDGRANQRYRSQAEDLDDVGFLLALIDRLSAEYSLDPARTYVTGASNGGMMTHRMACEASDRFAAAAIVIANKPARIDCSPARPISILVMNGTEDPLMPYQGGQVHFYQQQLGEVLSTDETVSLWAELNDCAPPPHSELLPDRAPFDGTRVRLVTHADCTEATQVLLYSIEGGGHTWPGGAQYAPRLVIGRVSRDLAANQVIWDFFASSTRLAVAQSATPAPLIDTPAPGPTPTLLSGPAPALPHMSVEYVMHGDRSLPWVALTFDVGQAPDKPAGFDYDIVEALLEYRAPATFFLGGDWMRTHVAETRLLDSQPLFELGNHSWSHPDMRELDEPQMHAEVKLTQDLMYRITGHQTRLFRFPSGWHNDLALSVVAWQGLYTIQWDVVIADPVPDNTADNILKLVQERTQNGSIVVMHANGRGWHTAEALPLIVAYLRGEGYCLVTVSQMVGLEPAPPDEC